MSGNHGFDVEIQHVIASVDPVLDGAGPNNRVTFDEEDIAGENQFVAWHKGQYVAGRVGGANLFEVHGFVADLDV